MRFFRKIQILIFEKVDFFFCTNRCHFRRIDSSGTKDFEKKIKFLKKIKIAILMVLGQFFLSFPSCLSNLRFFDLRFGFLVQNCTISLPEPQIWTKNDENPIKLIKKQNIFINLTLGLYVYIYTHSVLFL